MRLRDSWPAQQIEIKGSSLDEKQASQIIELLASFDVVVDFVAVDVALHTKDVVDDFKARQAAAIAAHVTREHHPEMVFQMAQLERTVQNMPNQLFVRSELTLKLIVDVLQVATLYFVQRKPEELGDIAWVVDRKGHTLTEMEETSSTLILPMSENHFMRKPLISLKEGDYSHFARYETDPAVFMANCWTALKLLSQDTLRINDRSRAADHISISIRSSNPLKVSSHVPIR